jgi:uncharacterized membrane protein YiaA
MIVILISLSMLFLALLNMVIPGSADVICGILFVGGFLVCVVMAFRDVRKENKELARKFKK